jgi:hypothetical protein
VKYMKQLRRIGIVTPFLLGFLLNPIVLPTHGRQPGVFDTGGLTSTGTNPNAGSAKPILPRRQEGVARSAMPAPPTPGKREETNVAAGNDPIVVAVSEKNLVSARVNNRPIGDLLGVMAEKKLFDIKGSVPPGESITMTFSDLSLHDALKKIMRGYNYVLIDQPAGQKPLLMVLGKTERNMAAETAVVQPSSPQPASLVPDPNSSYVPPNTAEAQRPANPATGLPNPQPRFGPQSILPATINRGSPPQQTGEGQQAVGPERSPAPEDPGSSVPRPERVQPGEGPRGSEAVPVASMPNKDEGGTTPPQ